MKFLPSDADFSGHGNVQLFELGKVLNGAVIHIDELLEKACC